MAFPRIDLSTLSRLESGKHRLARNSASERLHLQPRYDVWLTSRTDDPPSG